MDPELKARVLAILHRYFDALEDGSAAHLLPDPFYEWRHYTPDLDAFRARLASVDTYLDSESNIGWVNRLPESPGVTTGPGLGRLEDAQALALFQELDAVYGDWLGAHRPSGGNSG